MVHQVAVIGAGKIGLALTDLLLASGDYAVTILDRSEEALAPAKSRAVVTQAVDASDIPALTRALGGRKAVVNAGPFFLTPMVAEAAAKAGCTYLDLTEDVAATRAVKALAESGETAFIPQCGLAPGFVSILAADLARRFEEVDTLSLRVGALPQFPTNALKYNLTWSTEGLINEYLNPCEAIMDGRPVDVAPLEGRESLNVDGVTYEAFNTSGGLGTLSETLLGQVRNLSYRSIRYPGHLEILRLLLDGLRLRERRDLLKEVMETAIPATQQDVVLIFVTATGLMGGRFLEESRVVKVPAGLAAGQPMSAIQLTTAGSVAAVLDMAVGGELPIKGLVRQEEIPLDRFLDNRFGRVYAGQPMDLAPAPRIAA